MKGLAPSDQEAQSSKSTCSLPQGTEMVDGGWPVAGAGTRQEAWLPMTALGGSFVSLPSGGGGKLPESSEEVGERRDSPQPSAALRS